MLLTIIGIEFKVYMLEYNVDMQEIYWENT